jgi:hypothetical protein
MSMNVTSGPGLFDLTVEKTPGPGPATYTAISGPSGGGGGPAVVDNGPSLPEIGDAILGAIFEAEPG